MHVVLLLYFPYENRSLILEILPARNFIKFSTNPNGNKKRFYKLIDEEIYFKCYIIWVQVDIFRDIPIQNAIIFCKNFLISLKWPIY